MHFLKKTLEKKDMEEIINRQDEEAKQTPTDVETL